MFLDNFRPRRDSVFLKPIGWLDKPTSAGLFIMRERRPWEGNVLRVGSEVEEIQKGDRVLFQPFRGKADYSFYELRDGNESFFVLPEEVVYVVLKSDSGEVPRALKRKVLVEPIEMEERKGRLIIQNTFENVFEVGRVVCAGEETENIQPGDFIAYELGTWEDFEIDGKFYHILSTAAILGLIYDY